MEHYAVTSQNAPASVGPYSPSIVWQRLVFVSGQTPMDPETGKAVVGDIVAQMARALANIDALLIEAGTSREKVLKVNVYLAHMEDFSAMNTVYRDFFHSLPYPARTTVQTATLPGGVGVEIDVMAYR